MSQLWSGHDWSGNYLFFLVVLGFYWLVPWPRCVYPSSSFRPACVYVCVSVWVCMCVHVCPWRADELSCWALSILALSLLSPPPPPRPILCFFFVFNIQGGVAMDRISALPPLPSTHSSLTICSEYRWRFLLFTFHFLFSDPPPSLSLVGA